METIRHNLTTINTRLEHAANRAGRDPREIKLVAVSKRIGRESIQAAADCGQLSFGENYIQEARDKIPFLAKDLSWHFIGHLQSNKARIAAELFDVVETVDSLKLATALNKHLTDLRKTLSVLIQINLGGEQQKSGVPPAEAEKLIQDIHNRLPMLQVTGLMTMPPFFTDPESVRPYFRQLRQTLDELTAKKLFGPHTRPELSMGMSGDFEVAIEEGATIIRIGTAIFGPRT
jgi:pyridoxal phosphate enzyme (YggS family)